MLLWYHWQLSGSTPGDIIAPLNIHNDNPLCIDYCLKTYSLFFFSVKFINTHTLQIIMEILAIHTERTSSHGRTASDNEMSPNTLKLQS